MWQNANRISASDDASHHCPTQLLVIQATQYSVLRCHAVRFERHLNQKTVSSLAKESGDKHHKQDCDPGHSQEVPEPRANRNSEVVFVIVPIGERLNRDVTQKKQRDEEMHPVKTGENGGECGGPCFRFIGRLLSDQSRKCEGLNGNEDGSGDQSPHQPSTKRSLPFAANRLQGAKQAKTAGKQHHRADAEGH